MTSRPLSPLAIFDLDGTLVDTAADLVSSLNHTIAAAGLAPVTYDDLTHLVGQGARVMIKRAFALRETELPEAEIEPLYERFITHYRAEMPGESRPYPGIVDTLEALSEAGITLAVCTNKTEILALPLLEELGLTRYFAAITCGDTFSFRKPDARHILGTIEKAGGDVQRSIMVGDSINDILAAKNAAVPSIGVTFGYSDVPMVELEPDVVIDDFTELTPALFEELVAKGAAAA
ncbi:phosphoglycolate phosphatase [Agrobacterium leguminum]|uniref:Phosphoglycolate phosphatase n=1 Tax=Agrobacterium deltaense NCPPB 1641 TaxID=1183425 RepID=A0A1S7TKS6_9HYPH|nr:MULTISPECIES: phosphoglycolate phosphatase [Agrobacterium]WFS66914.1 phosphoglycolate phosphatase [Agrobacterium leguminum]CVI55203.1 phosphoglycolate phosphatase [Agrobacterium deltaense NCPPB 1641]